MYSYDSYGWLAAGNIEGRTTGVAPPASGPKTVGQPFPNWTGMAWVLAVYSVPPAPPAPHADPTQWLIDVGPFLDRFGASKLPALMSTEPLVAACVKDMMARKWIDLHRAEVAAVLNYMAGNTVAGLGTIAVAISGMNNAKVAAILTTPVIAVENSVLKKLYF